MPLLVTLSYGLRLSTLLTLLVLFWSAGCFQQPLKHVEELLSLASVINDKCLFIHWNLTSP